MKKLVIILGAFYLLSIPVKGQQVVLDSLNRALRNTKNDTSQARIFYHIANYWFKSNPDSAWSYITKAHEIFDRNNYKPGIADALSAKAKIKVNIGNTTLAINLYKEALEVYRELNNMEGQASVLNGLGVAHGKNENYTRSLSYLLEALKIYEQIGSDRGMSNSYLRIGVVHAKTNHLDDALKYYDKSLQLALKTGDKINAASLYNNIGSIYGQKKMLHQGLQALLMSRSLAEQEKFLPLAAEVYLNLGNMYRELNRPDSAVYNFKLAERTFTQLQNEENIARTYDGWAELLLNQQKYAEAKELINKSMTIARRINNTFLIYNNYQLLLKISKAENDLASSVEYYDNLLALKDSLYNIERTASLERLKLDYQQEKNEMQIELLKEDNLQKTRQRNILLVVIAVVAILLLALVASLFLIYKKNSLLKKQKQELVEMNQMKDKFLSILSHDLRSPLANILQLLQVVSSSTNNIEDKYIFDRLTLSTAAVLETMDNMLAWGKNNFGQVVINKKEINVKGMADRVIRFLKPSAENKNVIIENKIDSSYTITADENQVEFVLRNLVSNAIKFSFENGKVEIAASKKDNQLDISVRDYGLGMHEEKQMKLFDGTQQESTKGTAGEMGSGLGLVLSNEFIALHNGKLTVESKEGEGTEFVITLPFTA